FGPEAQRFLLSILLCIGKLEWTHLCSPCWMLLTQRMPNPGSRHENALKMRMPIETNAEHIPDFPLIPVRRRPKVGNCANRCPVFLERSLDPDICVAIKGQQVIDDGEVARRRILRMSPHALINGREVVEHPIRLLHFPL